MALMVVCYWFAVTMRYREEKHSLNRWVRIAMPFGTSLPDLLDDLANGCQSRLASQAKACTKRLNRGESIADAARRARFPLDGETVTALTILGPTPALPEHPLRRFRSYGLLASSLRDHESSKASSFVLQRFAYVMVTILLAWLIGMLVSLFATRCRS